MIERTLVFKLIRAGNLGFRGVSTLFLKSGFSFHLPGKRYEKADAEVVAAWKKEQHARLEEAFSDPDTVILCEDEMVLTQATTHLRGRLHTIISSSDAYHTRT